MKLFRPIRRGNETTKIKKWSLSAFKWSYRINETQSNFFRNKGAKFFCYNIEGNIYSCSKSWNTKRINRRATFDSWDFAFERFRLIWPLNFGPNIFELTFLPSYLTFIFWPWHFGLYILAIIFWPSYFDLGILTLTFWLSYFDP